MIETVRLIEETGALGRYQRDESSAFAGRSTRALVPTDVAGVCEVLRSARQSREPVTVRAAGTSITGAPVPTCGGWVLATERIRDLESLPDPTAVIGSAEATLIRGPDYSFSLLEDERLAVVPPGLRLFELSASLERYGLTYPPDPTELSAMIGGTIATNASGARSYHYGATRDWVEGLLIVFFNGRFRWIRKGDYVAEGHTLPLPPEAGIPSIELPRDYPAIETKNAAGLCLRKGMDLVDLFVGSEGILGIVAGALLSLEDRPKRLLQTAAFFPTEDGAFSFADLLREKEDVLSIEYFDASSLGFMREHYPDLPTGPHSCVLFEVEPPDSAGGNPYPPPEYLETWTKRLRTAGSSENWSVSAEDVAAMKEFRHSLPEGINRWVSGRTGKLGTDLAVPGDKFPELRHAYDAVRASGLRTVLFGHLGQYHLHLNFLPATDQELAEARRRYLGLARTAVSLGGTVSAEHGVGKKWLNDEEGTLRPYLYFMLGSEGLRAIGEVKRALDPEWLLNPDTMIPRG
ncbi:MAG: FAD-binding oxidoreductase [Spirochaetaceae bacterium]